MAKAKREHVIVLDRIPYIYYPVQFQNGGKVVTRALINSGSEFNVMILTYAKELGLSTRQTKVGARKIESSSLKIFKMVFTGIQVVDKLGRV